MGSCCATTRAAYTRSKNDRMIECDEEVIGCSVPIAGKGKALSTQTLNNAQTRSRLTVRSHEATDDVLYTI
jgi:hypothetical protein